MQSRLSKNIVSEQMKNILPITTLQRACACGQHAHGAVECENCCNKREGRLQHSATANEPEVAPLNVHDVLRSPGQPLDAKTRAFMEPRFGHDFSSVRVHTDSKAAESARAVNALAYTVGQNVVFGAGQYAPRTTAGQKLLAHELTHAHQQNQRSLSSDTVIAIGMPGDMAEHEAHHAAAQITTGHPARLC